MKKENSWSKDIAQLIFGLVLLLIQGLVFMLMYNGVMPSKFELPEFGYWESVAFVWMCHTLTETGEYLFLLKDIISKMDKKYD